MRFEDSTAAGTERPDRMAVAGYLGSIAAEADAVPAGTCFQLDGGVIVTAAHVLAGVGADVVGSAVSVRALTPGASAGTATVAVVDGVHDLAVLTTEHRFPATASLVHTSDQHDPGYPIRVTGTAEVAGPDSAMPSLNARGTWRGGIVQQDGTAWGRVSCPDVIPGMSGAPVRRAGDDAVIGIVSGHHNSSGGWSRDSVWVSRTEDLRPLLAGLTEVRVRPAPAAVAVDVLVTVSGPRVRLTGGGCDVSASHGGVGDGLRAAVTDAHRERARSPRTERGDTLAPTAAGMVSLRRAGRLLAESFLPPPIATALRDVLARAKRQRFPVRVGVAAPEWPWLPWETLADPLDGHPLALHPLVTVYRHRPGAPVRPLPGPLRIIVAIAAPDNPSGDVLDYERELRTVHAAVRDARFGRAQVRVVPFATTAALRAELRAGPAHVLHLSGHGYPGALVVETDAGDPRVIDAETFLAEAIPPGRMPPVISMAACHTTAPSGVGSASFADELMAHGAGVVIGADTAITDAYVTRVFSRVYAELTRTDTADVVAAVADARRIVHRDLTTSPADRDAALARMDEWSVLTVLSRAGSVPVLDPTTPRPQSRAAPMANRDRHAGLTQRDIGEFVGRRREQRALPDILLAPAGVGVVLHGIGGIGKTTLAAELIHLTTTREPDRLVVVTTGELSVDTLLGAVAGVLRKAVTAAGDTGVARKVVEHLTRAGEPWQQRWQMLREHLLPRYPLLLVVDNFEDNLTGDPHDRHVRDTSVAHLLSQWVRDRSTSRLLITSRFPFPLPGDAQQELEFCAVGPMSFAETLKLVWSLPALDRLCEADLTRVWRLIGGHPRTLEYLDALLAGGHGRFHDVTERMTAAMEHRYGDQANAVLGASATVDTAATVSATLAADDVLLPALLAGVADIPDTGRLLLGLAVYREPVHTAAALFQIGQPDEAAAHAPDQTGLNDRLAAIRARLTAGTSPGRSVPKHLRETPAAEPFIRPTPPRRAPPHLEETLRALTATSLLGAGPHGDGWFVHRWTATELERLEHEHDPHGAALAGRHRAAAEYWLWRVTAWPQDRDADLHDRLEARYHLLAAGAVDDAVTVTEDVCVRLDQIGAWDHETELVHDTLRRLSPDSSRRAAWIHQLSILAQDRGDYQEADRCCRQSLEINERLDNQAGIAAGYGQLGVLALLRGDYPEAERSFLQSLSVNERLGNQAGIAAGYGQLGVLAQARGHYPQAQQHYERCLEINEELDNQAGIAAGYGQLGVLAHLLKDYPRAERHYQQSLSVNERLGNQAGIAACYHQLGTMAQQRGNYSQAQRRYQQSLEINEQLDNQAGIAASYHRLGGLARLRGDYPEAERRYQQSLEIKERLGDQAGITACHHQLSTLAQLRGDHSAADHRRRQSREIKGRQAEQDGPDDAIVFQIRSLGNRLRMLSSGNQQPHSR